MSAPIDPKGLDDPDYAAFAWARFRRIMGWMTAFSLFVAVAVLVVLRLWMGFMPLLMAIFIGTGVFLTMALASALMGLVFLSAGSGHDELVEDPLKGQVDLGD